MATMKCKSCGKTWWRGRFAGPHSGAPGHGPMKEYPLEGGVCPYCSHENIKILVRYENEGEEAPK